MKAGNANCDTLTGTHALNAALIGLIQARKTGEGCRVDIGMMDTVMISCGETVVDYGKGTYTQSRFGNHDRFHRTIRNFRSKRRLGSYHCRQRGTLGKDV